MSRIGRWRRCPLIAGLVLTAGLAAQAAEEPIYLSRFDLPVFGDTIGFPRSVTADLHTGEVFVCDSRWNRILIYDSEGVFSYQITGGDVFSAPRDIAVDPNGFLLLAANHDGHSAVLELDFDGLFLREIVLTGIPTDAQDPAIRSLALSPTGDLLYAVDHANARLWVATRDGAVQKSVDLAAGYSDKEREDLLLGHVDTYSDRVLLAIPSAGMIQLFSLHGEEEALVGDKGSGNCKLGRPAAAAYDKNTGDLLIIDQQRMIILRWGVKSNRCLGEYYGIGYSPGYLYFPTDLALDKQDRLYVAQGFEGRVQMYELRMPTEDIMPPGTEDSSAPEAPR